MVKIIKGSYGQRKGNSIVPINAGATVELSKEQEERLVRIGIAERVNNTEYKKSEPAFTESESGKSDNNHNDGLPAYSEDMKLANLQEIAVMYGVDASKCRSKKEVIALIDAAQSELPGLGGNNTVFDGE